MKRNEPLAHRWDELAMEKSSWNSLSHFSPLFPTAVRHGAVSPERPGLQRQQRPLHRSGVGLLPAHGQPGAGWVRYAITQGCPALVDCTLVRTWFWKKQYNYVLQIMLYDVRKNLNIFKKYTLVKVWYMGSQSMGGVSIRNLHYDLFCMNS